MTAPQSAYTKLVTALNEAQATGKVLDVSNIEADGTGIRKIPAPKTTRGTKKWVVDFPVVSDNYQGYAMAMQILGDQYMPLAQQYFQLYGEKVERGQRQQQLPAPPSPFPMNGGKVATVSAAQVTLRGQAGSARSPRTVRSPRAARSPKAVRSPRVRTPKSPAILTVPGAVPRVPSPRGGNGNGNRR